MIRHIVLATLITLSCCTPPPIDPLPPKPVSPPGSAEGACRNLRDLHCPDGDPTPDGHTCEEVLEHALASDATRINAVCLETIKACSDEQRCSQ